MGKAEAQPARPLSPHLTIFRPYINMMMSILHRITGAANYFGTLLLAAWLTATASGPDGFMAANAVTASPIGLIILFLYSWSLIHHGLGGIRHFIWDTGRGFELPTIRLMSWATLAGSVTITLIIWFIGLTKWGAFS
ncbi:MULTISPECIES: succinate dehydrogenase, cytochrome b556 subunit [Rhodomicrobium]|uniref:succinate dehydrogenase, cytochrome b556 subunit n=1 Tax=Rhodomicrobium TaxID=1068 RepID=UPI000B4ADF58|nr:MULTISPECIES: succinate dehydrogenase, cytochrome b556 subunit [Rhodomicrobium]